MRLRPMNAYLHRSGDPEIVALLPADQVGGGGAGDRRVASSRE